MSELNKEMPFRRMCCNKTYITSSYIRIRQVTLLVLEIKVNLK